MLFVHIVTLFFFLLLAPAANAQSVMEPESILASELARTTMLVDPVVNEKRVQLDKPGAKLVVEYSSNVPLEFRISYPDVQDGSVSVNPFTVVRVPNIPPKQRGVVLIDLTKSPKWSPERDLYFFHIRAGDDATVFVHNLTMLDASFLGVLRTLFYQLFLDEHHIPSQINYLW